jgi:hypothetical protein
MAATVRLQGLVWNRVTIGEETFFINFKKRKGQYYTAMLTDDDTAYVMNLNKESYIKQKEGFAKNDPEWNKRFVDFLQNA